MSLLMLAEWSQHGAMEALEGFVKVLNADVFCLQWWFVNPDKFVPDRYFRINEFSGLLKRPSVQKRKSVPTLFVRISEISGLSEPGLTNHHCIYCGNVCIHRASPADKGQSEANTGAMEALEGFVIMLMCSVYILWQCLYSQGQSSRQGTEWSQHGGHGSLGGLCYNADVFCIYTVAMSVFTGPAQQTRDRVKPTRGPWKPWRASL